VKQISIQLGLQCCCGRGRSFEVVVGCTVDNGTEDDTKIKQYNFPNYQCVLA